MVAEMWISSFRTPEIRFRATSTLSERTTTLRVRVKIAALCSVLHVAEWMKWTHCTVDMSSAPFEDLERRARLEQRVFLAIAWRSRNPESVLGVQERRGRMRSVTNSVYTTATLINQRPRSDSVSKNDSIRNKENLSTTWFYGQWYNVAWRGHECSTPLTLLIFSVVPSLSFIQTERVGLSSFISHESFSSTSCRNRSKSASVAAAGGGSSLSDMTVILFHELTNARWAAEAKSEMLEDCAPLGLIKLSKVRVESFRVHSAALHLQGAAVLFASAPGLALDRSARWAHSNSCDPGGSAPSQHVNTLWCAHVHVQTDLHARSCIHVMFVHCPDKKKRIAIVLALCPCLAHVRSWRSRTVE